MPKYKAKVTFKRTIEYDFDNECFDLIEAKSESDAKSEAWYIAEEHLAELLSCKGWQGWDKTITVEEVDEISS